MMNNQAAKKEEKKKTAAVILSGCGFMDGSDVVESVSVIVELTRKGIVPRFFSPHEEIDESYNYITKQIDSSEERYMHKESARIAREKILSIDQLRADQFDMLVIPGGNGVVRNLSNFEQEEYNVNEVEVNSHVEKAIVDFFKQKKPIGFMSNSVILGAKALGKVSGKTGNGIAVALGKTLDRVFVETLMTKFGNELSQESGDAEVVCTDSSHRIASVASVSAAGTVQPNEIHAAAKNLIEELIDLTKREE
ncbi:predicted protein [Naegleria gruberi]|uniref:Predicted protein n=1 Tax=Naegleria gruberi TaxID=5762 RepID=D2V705_NAEGR|nr:uncharacterized protein NAEGRDRAFT_47168 [Naegleria gruberi]EFC47172.1 predicted protein [Naegleria gruberi]|eukprot:XP_002679916.1 predicted protein [Naegleria gruberi strain NEG-M]